MNRRINVSDITMKLSDRESGNSLSFRQKIELGKALDRLGVSVIEMGPIVNGMRDSLLVKSLASAVKDSVLTVPVDIFNENSVDETWEALKEAAHPRLQVSVPISTVQMEYLCHKKPAAVLQMVGDLVRQCAGKCQEVEFVAEDFSRSDQGFLLDVVNAAIENGASVITIFDTAGTLLGDEFYRSTLWMRKAMPDNVKLGVWCSNEMYMADSCAISAVCAGADEIKTTPYGNCTTSLKRFANILSMKSDACQAYCDVRMTELSRIVEQIRTICAADRKKPVINSDIDDEQFNLSVHDDMDAVMKEVNRLGYDLNDGDVKRVYDAFLIQASKNDVVTARELDAIVASVAFQAPETYKLESYLINSGNQISATCHMKLHRDEELLEGVCLGDGPVDAAFKAIEMLVGSQYELDDFQIQSVTQGREAMGGAVVRLRHEGKLFSGRGISTDIVEASIMAYLNAMNKIMFEGND